MLDAIAGCHNGFFSCVIKSFKSCLNYSCSVAFIEFPGQAIEDIAMKIYLTIRVGDIIRDYGNSMSPKLLHPFCSELFETITPDGV